MPRKLEAGLDGRYLISGVLMTSTVKAGPAVPPIRGNSGGVPVSAATIRMVGGSAEGRAEVAPGALAAPLAAGGVTALAAPATATPARNLRRLTSGRGSLWASFLRAMEHLPRSSRLSCAARIRPARACGANITAAPGAWEGGCPQLRRSATWTSRVGVGRQRRLAADQVGGLFRDHQHAGVDMGGDEIGHDRGVDHAQPLDPAHAQLRVGDRLGPDAHGAGAAGMVRRDRGVAQERVDLRVDSDLFAGRGLGTAERRHRLPVGDVAGKLEALAQARQVVGGGKEI